MKKRVCLYLEEDLILDLKAAKVVNVSDLVDTALRSWLNNLKNGGAVLKATARDINCRDCSYKQLFQAIKGVIENAET